MWATLLRGGRLWGTIWDRFDPWPEKEGSVDTMEGRGGCGDAVVKGGGADMSGWAAVRGDISA